MQPIHVRAHASVHVPVRFDPVVPVHDVVIVDLDDTMHLIEIEKTEIIFQVEFECLFESSFLRNSKNRKTSNLNSTKKHKKNKKKNFKNSKLS